MNKQAAKGYACPMHCEGDKVYQKSCDCPVCNLHLVPVDNNEKHAEHQNIIVQSVHEHKAKKR